MDSINPSAGGAQPSVRSESRLESGVQRRWVLPALRSLRQEEEVRFEAGLGYIVRPCCPLSPTLKERLEGRGLELCTPDPAPTLGWNGASESMGGHSSVAVATTGPFGCRGSEVKGLGGAAHMGELGEHRSRSSLLSIPVLDNKTSGGSEYRESDGSLDLQSTLFEDHWLQSSQATTERNTDDPEEEIPPEEMVGEELPEVSNLEDSLRRDLEVEVVGMSHLSINERTTPTTSSAKCRKKKNHRLLELAKPKFNWQCLKDRTGRCCKGHVWISPRKTNLQFCLYWPSVYWTERFIEDTTLTITVPEVSRRLEELSRPKRFYQEYYNNNRTTPIWPIPRSTLEYQASNRLKRLATPKIRNNIWSIDMSEVSQVSRAAQMAVPTPRTLRLAKPRAPATLLEEWDPMPKPKPYVSDYNRLLQLATPKALSEKCVPDRSPQWEVLNATKNAVASSRIISLAQPKIRKDLNEGYNPYYISPASLVAQASPRIYELAVPKHITKKV